MTRRKAGAKDQRSRRGGTVIEGFVEGDLPIRGETIKTRTGYLPVFDLQFYPDNPRVYSLVHSNEHEPSQETIERKLLELEHVKQLVQDIKNHGGLIEPLLVRDGTLDVLEGNSRLAAYRYLATKDATKWGRVKCTLLPRTISSSQISALLSQLHLKGKREWPPYEQAGHIYRRHSRDKVSVDELHTETGLGKGVLTKTIEAYELMVKHNDDTRERWSYYLEFSKPRIIAKVRESNPGFEKLVVKKIRSGEIRTAQDLRDKLPVICKSRRTISRFIDGRAEFESAYEEAKEGGAEHRSLNRLQAFRLWLAKHEVKRSLLRTEGGIREKIAFEVRRIRKFASELDKKLSG